MKEVIRPDGLRWQYAYNPGFPSNVPGNYSIKSVASPYGGVTNYSYGYVYFNNDPSGRRTSAISGKTTSGRNVTNGVWTYEYLPSTVPVEGTYRKLDKTIVTTPNGKKEFIHYGYNYAVGVIDALWLVGLVSETSDYGKTGNLLLQKRYHWDKRKISNENFWHGRDNSIDENTYAAIPTIEWTSHNGVGGQTITYEGYDAYGNPGKISASAYVTTDPDFVTTKTYLNDTENWRIGLVTREEIEGVGATDNTLNELGDTISENRFGVVTNYSYDTEGNLASRTDARNKTISYSNYRRGIAQIENHPQGLTITKDVNSSGTVASITNGRGYTRLYGWTPLNELKSITYPINSPVNINYSDTAKTLRRGGYLETTEWDGFGRPIAITRLDEATGESILVSKKYDAEGQLIFESYPNSNTGTSYEYDGLGRLIKKTHADGTFSTVAYPYPVIEQYTDEVGNKTIKTYRAFGSPDNQRNLVQVQTDLNVTVIQRNLLGQPTLVSQGYFNPDDSLIYGYSRGFTYSSKYFLEAEAHPDIGTLQYGRDEVGNLISKQVGVQPITYYSYDDFNRPVKVDYPDDTPDVYTSYDENGHVINLTNSISSINYEYDENDNLKQEVHTIDGKSYTLQYGLSSLDFAESVTYPSGRIVTFGVDSYGRARQALPHLTHVDYHPSGQVKTIEYANGEHTSYGLNSRQLVQSIMTTGQSPVLDLSYDYFANGDIQRITNALSVSPDRQVKEMTYDSLGRLAQQIFPNSGRIEAYQYDANGNIQAKTVNNEEFAGSYIYQGMLLTQMVTPDYRYLWVTYDAYGNVEYLSTTDILMSQLLQEAYMVHDHAGNLVYGQAHKGFVNGQNYGEKDFGGSFTYGYNGHNKKVKEVNNNGGDTLHYIYASNGQLIGEYPDDPAYGKEYVYVGSQMVASVQKNRLPQANAGVDQQVLSGAAVQLNGGNSIDKDGTIQTYAWSQVSGPTVVLQGADKSVLRFTAPTVEAISDLLFRLVVTDDDGETGEATVTVSVAPANKPPVANAGQDQTAAGGASVTLNGAASTDSDGSISSYRWVQTSGPAVSLANSTAATASFTAPTLAETTTLGFNLTVTDNHGDSTTDSVNIVVLDGVAPVSTFTSTKSRAKGVVSFQATVTTNEAATTYFRVTGQGEVTAGGSISGDWQTYSEPVTVKLTAKGKNAIATLEYYSVDSVGNQEGIKSGVLQ